MNEDGHQSVGVERCQRSTGWRSAGRERGILEKLDEVEESVLETGRDFSELNRGDEERNAET